MPRKGRFVVKLDIPEGADRELVGNYIYDAVRSMNGCLHPDDPMFSLDRGSLSVHWIELGEDAHVK